MIFNLKKQTMQEVPKIKEVSNAGLIKLKDDLVQFSLINIHLFRRKWKIQRFLLKLQFKRLRKWRLIFLFLT